MSDRYYRNKRILGEYNYLLKKIDDLTCEYAELYTQATKINQTLNDDVKPANHDAKSKVEGVTIKLAEAKAKLERAIARRNRIDKALNRLNDKWQYVVREVDINGRSISSVSKQLKMNYKYVINEHVKKVMSLNI